MASLFPLSLRVLLVELWSGAWCLTDGMRFSRPWKRAEDAMDDRTNFRRLTYGEELKGPQSNVKED